MAADSSRMRPAALHPNSAELAVQRPFVLCRAVVPLVDVVIPYELQSGFLPVLEPTEMFDAMPEPRTATTLAHSRHAPHDLVARRFHHKNARRFARWHHRTLDRPWPNIPGPAPIRVCAAVSCWGSYSCWPPA